MHGKGFQTFLFFMFVVSYIANHMEGVAFWGIWYMTARLSELLTNIYKFLR